MKINLLSLFAILITCQANDVSRSKQLDVNLGLGLNNDLSRRASLNIGGSYNDKNIQRARDQYRAPNVRRAGLGPSVYVGKTRGLNEESYLRRVGNIQSKTSQQYSAWRAGHPYTQANIGSERALYLSAYDKNPLSKTTVARTSQTDKDTFVLNQAAVIDEPQNTQTTRYTRSAPADRTRELGQRTYNRRTRDLDKKASIDTAAGHGRDGYVNRADDISQGSNIRRTHNLDRGDGRYVQANYINTVDGNNERYHDEESSSLHRLSPILRVGTIDKYYHNRVNNNNQGYYNEKTSNLNRLNPILRAGNYDQQNNLNRPDDTKEGIEIARAGSYDHQNYLNKEDSNNQGYDDEASSSVNKLNPILRIGNYNQQNYLKRADGNNQAYYDEKSSNLDRFNPILRSRSYDQQNYLSRADDMNQVYYNGKTAQIVRAGSYDQQNYLNKEDGNTQGYDDEASSSSVNKVNPILRAGNYNQQNYLNRADDNNQGYNVRVSNDLYRSVPTLRTRYHGQENYLNKAYRNHNELVARNGLKSKYDLNRSNHFEREPISPHGYSHPEIEFNPPNAYGPSVPDGTTKDDRNNNVTGSMGSPDNALNGSIDIFSNNNAGLVVPKSEFGVYKDGFVAANDEFGDFYNGLGEPNSNYGEPSDSFGSSDDSFGGSDNRFGVSNDGYGGVDYNIAADFEGDNKFLPNKITDQAIITAHNSTSNDISYNNSQIDNEGISNRGVFDDVGMAHHGFHNNELNFSEDDSFDDSQTHVEIHSNSGGMSYNNNAGTNFNNGHRVCSCDNHHQCEGGNCKRVTQTQTTATTCDICKIIEALNVKELLRYFEHCKNKVSNTNNCEHCKIKETTINNCEHCKFKKMHNNCEHCKNKETYNHCEQCTNKEMHNHCEHCKFKETHNNCEQCKIKETTSVGCECSKNPHSNCDCCSGGGFCDKSGSESSSCKCSHSSNCKCGNSCGCSNSCDCYKQRKPCNCNHYGYESDERYVTSNGVQNSYNYNGGGKVSNTAGHQTHSIGNGGSYGVFSLGSGINGRGKGASDHSSSSSSGGSVSLIAEPIPLDDTSTIITSITNSGGKSGTSVSSSGGSSGSIGVTGGGTLSTFNTGFQGGTGYNNLFGAFGNGIFGNPVLAGHGKLFGG